jgi:FkbH-like protein
MMFQSLPWLPQPTTDEREALKRLDGKGGVADLARLAALADRRWDAGEMGQIGRKLTKIVGTLKDGWQVEAKKADLSCVSLLMLFSETAAHLPDSLAAAALAHGIILNCQVVEYQEPETWLARNASRLAVAPPDVSLLSFGRESLRLHAALGNAAEADACVQAAASRIVGVCKQVSEATGSPVLVENLPARATDPQSSMDSWLAGSPRTLASALNLRLARLKPSHAYMLFDVAGMADMIGHATWSAGRYEYTAKLPFSPDCVPLYAYRLAAVLAALRGKSRRVLVLDLDNTLWGGVIGDDGVDGIVLGGNSALGRVHVAIQKMALSYKERGILLCVASKNAHEIALEAFRRHPEMAIGENDITIFQINWQSKVGSIRAMAETLNLGLDAFVFIDDNPAERKHVRDALPAVAVPELPGDASAWLPVIQAAAYFEQQSLSEEDLKRAEYYKGNIQRATLQSAAGDEKAFLESLKMMMLVAPFDAIGRKRIAQLIAKSNQFNLTTRRYSEDQIAEFEKDRRMETLQIRLSDVLGDNGMIAVVICRKGKEAWEIDTWLMSCRVLGRGVEHATLNVLIARARAVGVEKLVGCYIPTAKNGIVSDHYKSLGFEMTSEGEGGESVWTLDLTRHTPHHPPIQIVETVAA